MSRSGFGDVLKNPLVIGLLASHLAENLAQSYGQAKQNAMMPDPTEQAFERQALATGKPVTEMPNTGMMHRIFGVGSDMTKASPDTMAREQLALRGQAGEDLGNYAKAAELARYVGAPNYNAMMQGPFGQSLTSRGMTFPANMPYSTPAEEVVQLRQDMANSLNTYRGGELDVRNRIADISGQNADIRGQLADLKSSGGGNAGLMQSRQMGLVTNMIRNLDPMGTGKYSSFAPQAMAQLASGVPPEQVFAWMKTQGSPEASGPGMWTKMMDWFKSPSGPAPASAEGEPDVSFYGPAGSPSPSPIKGTTAPWSK
jgi:hypothetical protein